MFRFTIRDVLWLTVVVALAVGWWIEHQRTHGRHTRQLQIIARELDQSHFSLERDKDGAFNVFTRPAEDKWQPTTLNRP